MVDVAHSIDRLLMPDDVDYVSELGKLDSRGYLLSPAQLREKTTKWVTTTESGLYLPWVGCDLMKATPRRWSIWSGPTFAGKTNFLRFLMLWALQKGERVLFASLEEDPEEVLAEFIYMAACTRDGLNSQFVDWCVEHWDERLWIFNHTGFISPEVILGAACFAAENYGVTHVVIDSLMKLDMKKDDYDGQRRLGNTLDRVCRQHNIHIHIVIHPKKMPSSTDLMDMNDIEGAKDLVSQGHTVATVQRVPFDSPVRVKQLKDFAEDATTLFQLWKQRGKNNRIGRLALYYHNSSRQWLMNRGDAPIQFLPADAFLECGIGPTQKGMFG